MHFSPLQAAVIPFLAAKFCRRLHRREIPTACPGASRKNNNAGNSARNDGVADMPRVPLRYGLLRDQHRLCRGGWAGSRQRSAAGVAVLRPYDRKAGKSGAEHMAAAILFRYGAGTGSLAG